MLKSHVAPKNLVVKIESADVVNDGMRQTSHVVPKKLVVKTQSADVAQDTMRPKSHVVSNNEEANCCVRKMQDHKKPYARDKSFATLESEGVVDDDMPQNSHVETKQLVVKSDREAVAQDGMLQKFYTVHKNRAVKTGSNAVAQGTVQQYHTVVKKPCCQK